MLSLEYRPRSFADIIGQTKTKTDLINRSKGLFPQAILLYGPSGTGKTTTALIIAMTINCENLLVNGDGSKVPCQECSSCKSILANPTERKQGTDTHVYDASDMTKEDVLNLKNKLAVSPMYNKNKVIIIDEAQFLGNEKTKGALNLLLEETYANAYIILTTMDIDAFGPPENQTRKAILGRCQKYKFVPLTSSDIAEYLFKILKSEGLAETVPEIFITEGIFTIAEMAKGSVRDATQALERCINSEIYSSKDILEEFDVLSEEQANNLLLKLLKYDTTFFEDTKRLNVSDFFYLAWTTLIDSYRYSYSKEERSEFREKFLKEYSKYDIPTLTNVFAKAYESDRFNFKYQYFMTLIIQYFNKKLSLVGETSSPPPKTVNTSTSGFPARPVKS